MKIAQQVALDLTALGFVALAAAAAAEWYKRRGRAQAMIALSLGFLSLTSVAGRIQAVIGTSAILQLIAIVGFLANAYFVLLFRDAFLPLSARWRQVATALFVVSCVLGVGLVTVIDASNIAVATGVGFVLVGTWAAFLVEPIYRFWVASAGSPSVQRFRMRTLSFGFAVLVALVVVAVVGGSALRSPGGVIATQLIALAMVPVIYVSVAPPPLLKAIWRMGEQSQLRAAMQDLIIFSPGPTALAEQAVGWAMRLLGAHAAFIVDPAGKVMASRNVGEDAIADILKHRTPSRDVNVPAGEGGALLVAPLPLTEGTGYIGVIAGAFTPLFGSDEISSLEGYAVSVAAGIERTRVTERLATIEQHKSQFLNLASHELRGPMTVIRGYGSMLQSGMLGELNDRGRKAAEVMMAKILEMNSMIEQMIEAARLEDDSLIIKPQDADLRDIVTSAVRSIQPILDDGHRIEVQLPERTVRVTVDVDRIQTIVTNLIDNAVKYSPKGGDVTCTVASRGGIARVAVKDGGVGIAAADMATLFTRFGRVANPATDHLPGTGLGLYLGRQLARLHGGDITVESTPEHGSTFTLQLPIGERGRRQTPKAEPAKTKQPA